MIIYTHDKETRDGIIAIPVAQGVADNMSADGEIIAIQPVDSEKAVSYMVYRKQF